MLITVTGSQHTDPGNTDAQSLNDHPLKWSQDPLEHRLEPVSHRRTKVVQSQFD